ncbi:zinc transporter ZntB [Candidatus Sulfurimonas marisnigri]|uniref:Zinc transporter ZntB n=1 Tax=Candidatus Sulfurimonas marisnigri TaxID=2740405 RepID=A0A7S7LZE5_9BACT|nr:zinc transporter ZntB [Candidatus Sulfurimonas marisnigri]QOY54247.1 zinc transporter ZntB [Candidatus Sulfurimonas marisnigri]
MNNNSGLVFAFILDGKGGGKSIDLDGVKKWNPSDGKLWIHLDYTKDDAQEWINNDSLIDPVIAESLTIEETRPRSLVHKGGMLLILRGVNLNPGADPEDMVSIRLWIDANRIVTLRHRRVMAIDDLCQAVKEGDGPSGPGAFLEDLSDRLIIRMGTVISDIDDSVDALQDDVLIEQSYDLRRKIADIRRSAISLRRYLAPQRDVMVRLHSEKVEWLGEMERMRLREVADRTMRYVEDLDSVRDRATVTQEELNNRLAEQMNKTMYVLSIVAGIFLPLGLLTGLLGINVGGIPGTESKSAFFIFCFILLAIAAGQIWFFKRKKWM